MPPFLPARSRCDEILSADERLNPLNFQKTNYAFIDISLNKPDHVTKRNLKISFEIYFIVYYDFLETHDCNQRIQWSIAQSRSSRA